MKKSLKSKVLIGVPVIFIAVMLVVVVIVSAILSRQNRKVANTLIQNTFNIVRSTTSERQEKLLFDSHQMTSIDNMGIKIKYITESSSYFEYDTLRPTYMKIASVIYSMSTTANIWKANIYDLDGDLMAFTIIEEDGGTLGCVHNRETIEITSLEPAEELTRESWTKQDSLPAGTEYSFGREILNKEAIHFEIIDNSLCLVAYVPVMGKNYNAATEKMEAKQVGMVVTVQKLGTAFVRKVSKLSGTDINIFTSDAMVSGTYADYKTFDLSGFADVGSEWTLTEQPVTFNDIYMAEGSYFQGVLPIYSDSKCVAAIVSLYSKKMAKANTMQIIKLLSLVYFAGLILVLPITILVVVHGIINPVTRVASMMREIAYRKDFTKMLNIERQDEIGDLASSFNEMTENLRKTTTSIDNLNREITERKQAEAELKAAQEKLIETARMAGMAEVAADVLHNVGNVLNSINVSTTVIREKVTNSELADLEKVASIINEHTDDLGTFLTEDPQGKHIPVYLTEVSKCLTDEQTDIISKLKGLADNVQHIKDIISMQQSYAKVSGVEVQTSISKLAEDAIQINSAGLERHGVRLIREFDELGDVEIDKQRVLQILVNLVSNAKYALGGSKREEKLMTIRIYKHSEERFRIEVADNGVGISENDLTKIFSHGFTTKEHGHGFGLHSSALAAKEMGGSLSVHSDGVGQGATFTLELPFKPIKVMK